MRIGCRSWCRVVGGLMGSWILCAGASGVALEPQAGAAKIVSKPDTKPGFPIRSADTEGYVKAKRLPDGEVPPADVDGDFVIGPTHGVAKELAGAAATGGLEAPGELAHGRVVEFEMKSSDSKYYPGIMREAGTSVAADAAHPERPVVTTSHAAPYVRKVAVYVPKGLKAGAEAPLMVGADGPDWLLFRALDALIAAGKLPAMVAVSIGNGGGDAQGSERGLEYDTMSGKYAEFVEHEVLPEVEKRAGVRLTHDPEGRAATGVSSGGACALIMAWYHPEWYHRVLAYSGTWINQQWPWNAETPHGAWGFPEHMVAEGERKPIRIWMEVGDRDLYNPNAMRDGMHDWVLANELMAKALKAKGYHYQFVFAENAVHVDRGTREQTLPEALEYLWRGYGGR